MQTPDTCPCGLCGQLTRFTGTKRCDRCWELERRIHANPEIAARILAPHFGYETAAQLLADAGRWRFVRQHWSHMHLHWNNDETNSLKSVVLTVKTAHRASGAADLEKQIDAARMKS